MENIAVPYGKIIQNRRRELGDTQESFAEAIGLSQPFVGKLERGAADVQAMQLRNFTALLERLRWTAADFAEATGIDLSPLLGTKKSKDISPRKDMKSRQIKSPRSKEGIEVTPLVDMDIRTFPQPAWVNHYDPDVIDIKRTSVTTLVGTATLTAFVLADIGVRAGSIDRLRRGAIVFMEETPDPAIDKIKINDIYVFFDEAGKPQIGRAVNVDGKMWFIADSPDANTYNAKKIRFIGRVVGWSRTYTA